MKKFIAEFIGTCVLVTFGCGTAMLLGCRTLGGYLLTALAFGLAVVAMAYSVGNISGCHINPAVSLGVFLSGGMKFGEFIGYVVSQILGGLLGAFTLSVLFSKDSPVDITNSIGSNGLSGLRGSYLAGIIVEAILTFVFVFTVLGVTSKKHNHGSFGGLIIGLTLTLVHIFGIGFTGTSVNPARSIGPAVISALNGVTKPLSVVWVFIVGPLAGAALAALAYRFLEGCNCKKQEKEEAE